MKHYTTENSLLSHSPISLSRTKGTIIQFKFSTFQSYSHYDVQDRQHKFCLHTHNFSDVK